MTERTTRRAAASQCGDRPEQRSTGSWQTWSASAPRIPNDTPRSSPGNSSRKRDYQLGAAIPRAAPGRSPSAAGKKPAPTERSGAPGPTRQATTLGKRVVLAAGEWDYPLVGILVVILALGLVMVFSASIPTWGVRYFVRQVGWIALGVVVMLGFARISYLWLQRLAIPIMIVALAGLTLVLFFGEDILGARRTFFGSIQPSEFAKLAVVVYVAAWVASKGAGLRNASAGLIPFAILMGLITALIVLEPNFSTALVILSIGVAIFFVGGADIKQLLLVTAVGLLVFAIVAMQSKHAVDRVESWVWALSDPAYAPENVRRALELMRQPGGLESAAEVWQQKYSVSLLWSDFLFANIGHDLRLPGQLVVVGLFTALGYRCLGIVLHAPDSFSALAAVGVTTWILAQAAVHIGTSLALVPATGQPLPFMSYGGSGMVASMAGMGLLLNIAHASPEKKGSNARFTLRRGDRRARVSDPGRNA